MATEDRLRAMAARNPGPFLQKAPMGFMSYDRKCIRDFWARKAYTRHEVNHRIFKYTYDNFGVRGTIPWALYVNRARIRRRCIQVGNQHRVLNWSQMSRHGFHQAMREGWLLKYGLDYERAH
mmetsp:Transcript_15875/g.35359  ORF Transcript_15875/g.35359 Transcript_15875/m.35359 type:complete len:122 (-) Transcript_15875:138-503(-)